MKLSVAIPYRDRLQNIRIAFEALARQTLDHAEFEVIVGCMEYAPELIVLCREFSERLSIVTVVSGREFSIPRARNLAMRQAAGEVVVQMDADTLLPPDALRNLYDRHFSFGQRVCVVGQVVGYDNNEGDNVTAVEARSYSWHLETLETMAKAPDWPADPRFRVEHTVPWMFGWTGLIALPRAVVLAHDLHFDEDFHGWGVDDLEWSRRVCSSGTPITLCPDVYALHLPHVRDAVANRSSEILNYRRFLRKWPAPDVELAHAFGDIKANSMYLEYQRELRWIGRGATVGSVHGRVRGKAEVVVGVRLGVDGRLLDEEAAVGFDDANRVECLPLAGLALPYPDGGVRHCRITPSILEFSPIYRDAVFAEANRIAERVTAPESAGAGLG